MASQIRAICFDMDGVLVDAADWHYRAFNKALKKFDIQISRKEHLAVFNGLPTQRKLDLLSEQKKLNKIYHSDIHKTKQIYTHEEILLNCSPNVEKIHMLSKLKEEGYLLALCSNSIRRSVELILDKSNLLKYFDLILSNTDITKPKPNPEIYLKAIRFINRPCSEIIALEDTFLGMKAAQSAGLEVLKINSVSSLNYQKISNFIG